MDVCHEQYGYDPAAPSLCEAFKDYFRVGAAISTKFFDGEHEKELALIKKQYNAFVLSLQSKPSFIHPAEDRYVFEPVDRFVAFGKANGARLRGHTLVWHQSVPDWFFYDKDGNTVGADLLIARMNEHIRTIVSRYRGQIDSWDVCNEVFHKDGIHFRDTMWYKIAGTRFIKEAFRTAHEADPDARLILNDYLLEETEGASETLIRFVTEMVNEGVAIHGIGLQFHHYLKYSNLENVKKNIRKLLVLKDIIPGFKLEVTEFDMNCYDWDEQATDVVWTDELRELYRYKYVELFRFFMELSREGFLDSVLFWGTNDGDSWLNGFPREHKNYPLLFDRELKIKPVMYDLLDLAAGKI